MLTSLRVGIILKVSIGQNITLYLLTTYNFYLVNYASIKLEKINNQKNSWTKKGARKKPSLLMTCVSNEPVSGKCFCFPVTDFQETQGESTFPFCGAALPFLTTAGF